MKQPTNLFYAQAEQARCANPECDAVIPAACIASSTDASTGVRTVRAWCQHCDRLWMAKLVLAGDRLQFVEPVHEITDTRLRKQFRRRIERALGEIQREKLPPVKAAI
jgi:hypothetical protein